MKVMPAIVASAALAASVSSFSSAALAVPMANAAAIRSVPATTVEPIQWRGRGWRGRGWGPGAGFFAGALLGGALAAPYAYDDYYGYGYGYRYPYPHRYGYGYPYGWGW